ncbi:glycoside hydrolase family 3 N-terminal domain-containing protein [Phyllobacterium zundukense]|uniref:beta-N-acetylhexosaminidase n=1 Tax=Phyllobacterium zundukense TaxID=1867719 RepID=A0A2N9W0S7_9HYPH|nr:glycoside hydrolase family 3 N-terminal domain-containing protein [Phyllobacterium zundukense]ATU90410.1 beta-N-acetylhexosaminidase [Phyllobacterium zundukense]PIO45345.1 beta-N-acetylhexosaminidase [Phyllobacterium zundukense]
MSRQSPLALFVGIPNPTLSPDEIALFRDTNPLGLFVGRRNLREPDQAKALVASFREAVGRDDAPVFTDQEGGRVEHLDAGPWPLFRSFGEFAELARHDLALAKQALRLSSRAMGTMMSELGLTSGCSPVLDLVFPTTSAVIGARSFGADPELVATLGREVVEGLLETGNMPIMKHIPGHGRATLDSHKERPVVDASRETLLATDFKPFVDLKGTPWAMVAHVVYSAYDKEQPASVSPVLHDVIRNDLGYDGVLISDCIFMNALEGTMPERVKQVLDAGYDIALHSHGDVADSEAAAKAARPLSEAAARRIDAAKSRLGSQKVNVAQVHAEVENMFASAFVS